MSDFRYAIVMRPLDVDAGAVPEAPAEIYAIQIRRDTGGWRRAVPFPERLGPKHVTPLSLLAYMDRHPFPIASQADIAEKIQLLWEPRIATLN